MATVQFETLDQLTNYFLQKTVWMERDAMSGDGQSDRKVVQVALLEHF